MSSLSGLVLVIVTSLCFNVEWVLVIERSKGTRSWKLSFKVCPQGMETYCIYANCVVLDGHRVRWRENDRETSLF
jgi:hypothetical protein